MGASMTSGTNWSNANLNNITPDDKAAAKELAFVAEEVPAGRPVFPANSPTEDHPGKRA